jgi:hypothetical protein
MAFDSSESDLTLTQRSLTTDQSQKPGIKKRILKTVSKIKNVEDENIEKKLKKASVKQEDQIGDRSSSSGQNEMTLG